MKKPKNEVWCITWSKQMRLKRPHEVRLVDVANDPDGETFVPLARFATLDDAESYAEQASKALAVRANKRPRRTVTVPLDSPEADAMLNGMLRRGTVYRNDGEGFDRCGRCDRPLLECHCDMYTDEEMR